MFQDTEGLEESAPELRVRQGASTLPLKMDLGQVAEVGILRLGNCTTPPQGTGATD